VGIGDAEIGGVKAAMNGDCPGLGAKIQKFGILVQDAFGNHPFNTLYNGNLRPFIHSLEMFVAKDRIDTILDLFDDLFGKRTPIGLVNFRYLTLDQIFNVIGIKGYNDLRLPHYFSTLTRKTLLEQLRSLENYLGIYGTDKVSDINAKKIDFEPLLTDLEDLLSVNPPEGKESLGTLSDSLNDLDDTLNRLGFVDDPRDGVILRDSLLGHLMIAFMPGIATTSAKEIKLADHYDDRDDIMRLILNLRLLTKKMLVAEDIHPFVEAVLHNSEAFMIAPSEIKTFYSADIVSYGRVSVGFFPSEVILKDGSHLTGESTSITLEFSRSKLEEKLHFTKMIINDND